MVLPRWWGRGKLPFPEDQGAGLQSPNPVPLSRLEFPQIPDVGITRAVPRVEVGGNDPQGSCLIQGVLIGSHPDAHI